MDIVLLASAIAAFLLYSNTLDAEFAYDDSRAIKSNPDVLPTTPLRFLLTNDFWGTPLTHSGSHKSYRPLTVLSFRINYAVSELRPWSYHLTNVVLHVLATILFTKLARILLQKTMPTAVASLVFAVHPIHTEAVSGVVGRADVGACIFFLLSLFSYMKYTRCRDMWSRCDSQVSLFLWVVSWGHKWTYLSLCIVTAALSMFTKEHGISVLAVCATYDVFVHCRIKPKDIIFIFHKRYCGAAEGVVTLVCAGTALLLFRLHIMGAKPPEFAPADNPAADCDSLQVRSLTFLFLPAFNFWLLLHPGTLSFDWSMEAIPLVTSMSDPRNVITVLFYVFLCVLCYVALCRAQRRGHGHGDSVHARILCHSDSVNVSTATYLNQNIKSEVPVGTRNGNCTTPGRTVSNGGRHSADVLVVSMSIMVLSFLPATNLFFYVGFVVAERILYIPSMGYCLLLGLGFQCFKRRYRRTAHLLLFFLITVLSLRTIRRNQDWSTEERLYRSGIKINPPKAYGNLANILSARGEKEEAEWAYKKALGYRSNMADVHYNLGILYQEQRRYEEAINSYRSAIQFRPRMAMAHLNLGLVLGLLGRPDEAMEVYRHCSHLDSTGLKDPRTHEATKISALFNLGRLYADHGDYDRAIEVYHEAILKMPSHYQPQSLYNMLGEAYFKAERWKEAEVWYREALKAKPDHVPAHLTYGKLLAKTNQVEEAEQWFLRARQLSPNDSAVYQHYGQFLAEQSRNEEAAEVYVKAASLAPTDYEVVFNAANTLRQAGRNQDAESFYRIAVRLRPSEPTSHMNLGAMLHVNGKLREAEQSYLEALRLKPDDNITHTNLQKLRTLLNKRGPNR